MTMDTVEDKVSNVTPDSPEARLLAKVRAKRGDTSLMRSPEERLAIRKVMNAAQLASEARRVLALNCASKEDLATYRAQGARLRGADFKFRVTNLVGMVTIPGWAEMVANQVGAEEKYLSVRQPNGRWTLAAFEVDEVDREMTHTITDLDGSTETLSEPVPYLMFSVVFVDALNNNDIDNRHVRDLVQRVETQVPAPPVQSVQSGQAGIILQMQAQLAAQQEQMQALVAQLAEQAAAKPARGRRRKAAVEQPVQADDATPPTD